MWLRIRSLIVKELLAVVRSPGGRRALFMPTIVQMIIFPFAATQEVTNVQMAVLNEDWGKPSRDLIARFEGSPNFTQVRTLAGDRAVAEAIDSREALMVLHIGPDFSRKVASGIPARVQLILDGRRSNAAQILQGYASMIIDGYGAEIQEARGTPGAGPVSVVVVRSWFNPNLLTLWNTVPCLLAILTTLIALMVTALSVARERELGTFEQLLVSPLQPLEIVLGKSIPPLLIGILEGTFILGMAVFVYRVPFTGSLALLFGALAVYLCSVIGVGLFISSLAVTQQQAVLGTFTFVVPAIMLSGYASPIENMPDWLQVATLANPMRHFLVIVKGVFLKDMPPSEVLHNLLPVLAIACVTLPSAAWLFRRRLQ
jgi:ABC-2 type transport system permease protein